LVSKISKGDFSKKKKNIKNSKYKKSIGVDEFFVTTGIFRGW
jgi:hypothetical protein